MTTGVDYSFSHPSPSAVRTAGAAFVARYLAPVNTDTAAKVITAAEAEQLHAAGLAIVLVWESTATRAASGRSAGVADARAADAQARALGADGVPLFFAVDFDATSSQLAASGAVRAYAEGWASVLGGERSGVYGGYTALSTLMSAGICRYGWQTAAWSGGRWYSGAQIRQGSAGSIGGHSVDWDTAITSDYGQWEADVALSTTDLQKIAHAVWTEGIAENVPGATPPVHQAQTYLVDTYQSTAITNQGVSAAVAALTAKVDAVAAGVARIPTAPVDVAALAQAIAADIATLGAAPTAEAIANAVEQQLAAAFSAAANGGAS
jgi:hypothetical protein